MKRLILFITIIIAFPAFGQITITSDQFLIGLGQQTTSRSYSTTDLSNLATLIATTGANQSWDFGGRVWVEEAQTNTGIFELVEFPGSVPLANDPDFAPATHALRIKDSATATMTYYMLIKFNTAGYWIVGQVQDSAGVAAKVLAYVPPLQQMAFPLTYLTEWQSTSEVKTGDGIPGMTLTQQIAAKVDGYGNLVLPTRAGKPNHDPSSTTQTLRLETKLITTTTFDPFSFSTTSYQYQWMTMSAYSAYIPTDSNKTPYAASYTTPSGTGGVNDMIGSNALELRIGANPVIAETEVSVVLKEAGDISVGIFDQLGHKVQMIPSLSGNIGKNTVSLNVHELPNGTYYLRVDAGAQKAIRKIIVSK